MNIHNDTCLRLPAPADPFRRAPNAKLPNVRPDLRNVSALSTSTPLLTLLPNRHIFLKSKKLAVLKGDLDKSFSIQEVYLDG